MSNAAVHTDLARALDPSRIMAAGVDGEPDPWQNDVLRGNGDRTLMLVTRQGGKSTTIAAKALHRAVYTPGSLTLLVAPSQRQSSELFAKVTGLYRANDRPVGVDKVSALRMTMKNGSRILALPGSEKTIRGYSGVDLLVLDEAARVDDELYYAVRPMLAVSGGELVALTTPYGKRGWFYDEWTEGAGDWQRVRVTAYECPRISEEFLEEERRKMPDMWFRAEYLCEFTDTVDSVFATEDIERMFDHDDVPLLFNDPGGGLPVIEEGDDIPTIDAS